MVQHTDADGETARGHVANAAQILMTLAESVTDNPILHRRVSAALRRCMKALALLDNS